MQSEIRVPDKVSLDNIESRWTKIWEEKQIYAFDRSKDRKDVYSIDTPPPTVSGELHIGHVFSYTQTDIMARFWRMQGKAVFYPMGFDDNGLPTERRAQQYYGIRCEPSQPYEANFVPPKIAGKTTTQAGETNEQKTNDAPVMCSRPNFVELCRQLTEEDEKVFRDLFVQLGVSVDWSLLYTTIGELAQKTSQSAFLQLAERGHVYRKEAPTLWDIDFCSAIAQAEIEDREIKGAYYKLNFTSTKDNSKVVIATTRPELLPACVALVCDPEDPRYRHLIGTTVTTPLFHVEVPIYGHGLADKDKGTGIAMVCTFGDTTDVIWWKDLNLPTRVIIDKTGKLEKIDFSKHDFLSRKADVANEHYSKLAGLSIKSAKREIVKILEENSELVGEIEPISHMVKFYEKGENPLEIISSNQWYIKTLEHRDDLIEAGRRIQWHPSFMRMRFETWVEGLNSDWNISRQRYFGVPFPVWYKLDSGGNPIESEPIFADKADLPLDPSTTCPPGYDDHMRNQKNGFIADNDVMDTWATSSLTPQIASRWADDSELFEKVFPMDLRPQAHEIIRTWLFSTVVRSLLHHDNIPFSDTAISGWILDKDHKKLSKSKGNAVVPTRYIETYGTDAVRYWAGSARLGTDTALDEQQMKIGRRLAIKLLNAAKFVLGRINSVDFQDVDPGDAIVYTPLDVAMHYTLANLVTEATRAFQNYEYAKALDLTEKFFWNFCDDYLELSKLRTYETSSSMQTLSAIKTLEISLYTVLKLFAPFLPFTTEEIWSWSHTDSIHTSNWPLAEEVLADIDYGLQSKSNSLEQDDTTELNQLVPVCSLIMEKIRKQKSEGKLSMKAPVKSVVISADKKTIELIRLAQSDLANAGGVNEFIYNEASLQQLEIDVILEADTI